MQAGKPFIPALQRRGFLAGFLLRKVYLIKVDECPVGDTSLRLKDTGSKWKNQYSSGVRWVKDYEI